MAEATVTTPENRQTAIDVMTQALVDNGMDDDEAEQVATEAIDGAIAEQDQS